jgi:hypothetical protein
MPVGCALLLLGDIVGNTKFMRFHRINLAHSQDITARLLESMVDAVPSLELVEIEGDAVFLYAPYEEIADRPASESSLDLGEVATQTIKKRTKLVGIDVIAAHRMLKNDVPVEEYVLKSDSVYCVRVAACAG